MAGRTHRLPIPPRPEQLLIALMRLDMIHHGCRRIASGSRANRVRREEIRPCLLPLGRVTALACAWPRRIGARLALPRRAPCTWAGLAGGDAFSARAYPWRTHRCLQVRRGGLPGPPLTISDQPCKHSPGGGLTVRRIVRRFITPQAQAAGFLPGRPRTITALAAIDVPSFFVSTARR